MEIVVDKRTELMGIVLALSQSNEYIKEHFTFNITEEYRHRALEHFSKFKNHKCIKLVREIAKTDIGFNFDNPIRLAFSLNNSLNFSGKIEKYLLDELENEDLIKEFLKALVDFSKESEFISFYNKNNSYYLSKIKEIENLFNDKNFTFELHKFLKRKDDKKIQVNIIPMLINANHGFENNNINIANIGLLSENFKEIEQFNNQYINIIIHEICHCYVNANTQNKKLQIPEELKTILKNYGYNNHISYLNDTIVRAMTIRLVEKIKNIEVEKIINKEANFGFIYVKDVYQAILKYEEQDLCWEDYFPQLISFINCYDEQNIIKH